MSIFARTASIASKLDITHSFVKKQVISKGSLYKKDASIMNDTTLKQPSCGKSANVRSPKSTNARNAAESATFRIAKAKSGMISVRAAEER